MSVAYSLELRVVFQYSVLVLLSVTVIVHGIILPCGPKDIPVYIWNNCSYQCNIIASFNTLVALCEDDQKTLATCEDGVCARGMCRTATCLCLEADECVQCQAIAHFCTERKTREEITTTSNYNEWWLDQQNINKNQEKEKSSGSFSWKTFVLIVALFVICMIILLTVEKLSGVKFRDIIRGGTTSTRRPPAFDTQPASAPIAPIRIPDTQYPRANLPAHQNRAPHIPPPPDLPPSYDIALAITDPPPSYCEVNKKSDITR